MGFSPGSPVSLPPQEPTQSAIDSLDVPLIINQMYTIFGSNSVTPNYFPSILSAGGGGTPLYICYIVMCHWVGFSNNLLWDRV